MVELRCATEHLPRQITRLLLREAHDNADVCGLQRRQPLIYQQVKHVRAERLLWHQTQAHSQIKHGPDLAISPAQVRELALAQCYVNTIAVCLHDHLIDAGFGGALH